MATTVGDRGDAPALADLVERGIEPDVGVLTVDRAGEERPHLPVEDLADARDRREGDPVDAQGPHQVIDLAGRHAFDAGLDDDGVKRLFGSPARLKQRGAQAPVVTFGILSSIVPTRVSQVLVR